MSKSHFVVYSFFVSYFYLIRENDNDPYFINMKNYGNTVDDIISVIIIEYIFYVSFLDYWRFFQILLFPVELHLWEID